MTLPQELKYHFNDIELADITRILLAMGFNSDDLAADPPTHVEINGQKFYVPFEVGKKIPPITPNVPED